MYNLNGNLNGNGHTRKNSRQSNSLLYDFQNLRDAKFCHVVHDSVSSLRILFVHVTFVYNLLRYFIEVYHALTMFWNSLAFI